jgi:DNA-binding NtrC family response regulator
VSRQHAILRGGSPPTIEDAGSANGVRVRGARISPRTPVALSGGDVVELGTALLVVQPPPGSASSVTQHPPPPSHASPMQAVTRLLEAVAKSDLSVLFLGETGVGKTVAAETVHRLSARKDRPFVRLNCPAFPETLLESELFGHERGAFTGAARTKPGLLETADGGTVFLDEIGEIPLATQAKLLGAIETREVQRLGSLTPRRVDVRIVSATNRDLDADVAAGTFRQDLYFRLDGLSIVLPPLRARRAEIAPLARRFLEEACARSNRPVPDLSPAAVEALEQEPWPGNLRELRNTMDRAAVLCSGEAIAAGDLEGLLSRRSAPRAPRPVQPAAAADEPKGSGLRDEIEALERRRIVQALADHDGNQTRAAKALGMSRRTFVTRLEAYGVPRPRKARE